MIQDNYNKTVKVQRLAEDGGNSNIENYVDYITAMPCHIQPLDDAYAQDLDGNFGKDWYMYCDSADILEGDRIIDGSDVYRVASVKKFKFLGLERHMECKVRRSNP